MAATLDQPLTHSRLISLKIGIEPCAAFALVELLAVSRGQFKAGLQLPQTLPCAPSGWRGLESPDPKVLDKYGAVVRKRIATVAEDESEDVKHEQAEKWFAVEVLSERHPDASDGEHVPQSPCSGMKRQRDNTNGACLGKSRPFDIVSPRHKSYHHASDKAQSVKPSSFSERQISPHDPPRFGKPHGHRCFAPALWDRYGAAHQKPIMDTIEQPATVATAPPHRPSALSATLPQRTRQADFGYLRHGTDEVSQLSGRYFLPRATSHHAGQPRALPSPQKTEGNARSRWG